MARFLWLPLVVLVVLLAAPPARAADAVVGSGTPASCTESAFDAALAAVQGSGGRTITFNCGGAATINFTAQKGITATVVVDGGGTVTLDGLNANRLFAVGNTGNLALQDITLINGYSGSDGGAIDNQGSLTLTRATIRDSNTHSDFSGGAIVSDGRLTVTDSLFENNGAGKGGALYLLFEDGETAISGSTFRNNRTTHSENGYGGAISVWYGADLVVRSSDFDGNQADFGGAIHNAFANSSLELAQGTKLHGNTASIAGGGLYNYGTAVLTEVTLSGNSAARVGGGIRNWTGTITLTQVTLSGNSAVYDGGGMYNQSGTATLADSTLSGNSAGRGGGIYNWLGSATLTNVTLSGNSAANDGGGIRNSEGTVTLTHVTLSGNSAGEGGGIWHYGGAGQVLDLKDVLLAHGPSGGNCSTGAGSVTDITSAGFNLSSDLTCAVFLNQGGDLNNFPPHLGPLADNGGPTQTHMLLGAPAVDNGQCLAGVTSDQRGKPRPAGVACDIGAVERQADDRGAFVYLPAVLRQWVR